MTARSAHTEAAGLEDAVRELVAQLGPGPHALVFVFASTRHDVGAVADRLQSALDGVPVVGCSTCGEVSERRSGTGGISAMALPRTMVARCATALAEYQDGDVEAGVRSAVADLEASLGQRLSALDTERHVGVVLIEGFYGSEEWVNAALGCAAPFLSFVGGSAGEDLKGGTTTCAARGRTTSRGCALVVMEITVPYSVLKTCHFVPTDRRLTVTRAEGRVVHEFDGRPADEVYAEALGVPVTELSTPRMSINPLGVMIDGRPWIRLAIRRAGGGGLWCACEIPESTELHLMRSTGKLIEDTADALADGERSLGRPISAALLFNCTGRRLEMDALGLHQAFIDLFAFPAAGFHTYGESWLGHMNQTLTGLLLG